MPIDVRAAQRAISRVFHTNPATIERPTTVNVGGIATQTFDVVATTTCHVFPRRVQPRGGVANDEQLGEPVDYFLTFPYGTDVRKDDRVQTLGRTCRVVYVPPTPQFALEVSVGVIEL